MENQIKMYAIEWHNEKNYSNKVIENYEEAKSTYDNCTSKDSFNICLLKEIIWNNGEKTLFNIEKVKDIMKSYDLPETNKISTKVLFQKEISNNGHKPKFDTTDLANAIS